jgi:hypothetical protein
MLPEPYRARAIARAKIWMLADPGYFASVCHLTRMHWLARGFDFEAFLERTDYFFTDPPRSI